MIFICVNNMSCFINFTLVILQMNEDTVPCLNEQDWDIRIIASSSGDVMT